MLLRIVLAAALLTLPLPALPLPTLPSGVPAVGDAEHGQRLAHAARCVRCHGAACTSNLPGIPPLGGQDATYLAHQIEAFRAGRREHSLMRAMDTMLTDREMADILIFYTRQRCP